LKPVKPTTATYPGVPGKPRNVHWTKNVQGRITVTWQAPRSSGGAPITRYDIYPGYVGGYGFDPKMARHVTERTFSIQFTHMDKWMDWVFAVVATNAKSQGMPSRFLVDPDPLHEVTGQMLLEGWLQVISAPGQWAYRHGFGEIWANTPRMGTDTIYWKGPVPALIRQLVDAIPNDGPIRYGRSRFSSAEIDRAMTALPFSIEIHTASGIVVSLNTAAGDPVVKGLEVEYWPTGQPDTYQGPFPAPGEVAKVLRFFTGTLVPVTADAVPPPVLVQN
jgi:hypothetical protein